MSAFGKRNAKSQERSGAAGFRRNPAAAWNPWQMKALRRGVSKIFTAILRPERVFLLVGLWAFAVSRSDERRHAMGDVVYLALILGGFAICWLAVGVCERL